MRILAGAFSTTLLAIIPLFCGFFAGAGPVGAQIITTVAGNGTAGYSGDGGPATSAQLNFSFGLAGVAVDTAGNLYIADNVNCRIRKVAADGTITTVAGNGTQAIPAMAGRQPARS